jgi:hypothetical protein
MRHRRQARRIVCCDFRHHRLIGGGGRATAPFFLMQFKVRDHFYVHLHEKVHGPGSVLELSEEDAALVAHQIEPVVAAKPARKAKADGAD